MKWILFLGMSLSAQFSHAYEVVYQSGPYGSSQGVGAVCSSSTCLDPGTGEFNQEQYIGESFSLTSAAKINTIDFYKGLFATHPTTEPVDIPSDITIAFYDASHSLVYSQTFNVTEYIQTERYLGPGTGRNYNIHAAFTPFILDAGDYIVYYFGDHLGLPLYGGYGDTSVLVSPSQGGWTFDNPFYAFGATAVKLSGSFLTAVPEPESFTLMLAGLGLAGFTHKRKKENLSIRMRV